MRSLKLYLFVRRSARTLCSLLLIFPVLILGDPNYTDKERVALHKFRELVQPKLTEDFMNFDSYLIKWLQAQNFDLNASKKMLEQALEWRQQNRIDSILTENLSSIYRRAPYQLDGLDKAGRPVLIFNPGRWDIRRFVMSGEGPKLSRFLDQMLEMMSARVTELGHNNVTQGVVIFDIEGYNFRQHGCLQCVGPLLDWIRHYESYYPGLIAGMHIINNPRIFSPLLEIIRPLFSAQTAKILQVHGPDKNEWSKIILQTISADQLSPQYGGTKM